MSGPNRLTGDDNNDASAADLVRVLNIEHMSDKIGAAVAVKMCFGMTTKGYIALAIQSFTTAYRLGVLEELESFLDKYKPNHLRIAREGLVRMPHTAYRWVFEMLEMAETAEEYGGFDKTLSVFTSRLYCYRLCVLIVQLLISSAKIRGRGRGISSGS